MYSGCDESLSYAYEGTGKIWNRNKFEWYGERYSIGDIITCYADFESECGNILLSFAKNDLNIELEYRINYEDIHSGRLFSHIFIKNLSFQTNFGQLNTKYFLRSNFRLINDYDEDERILGRLDPSSKQECEVNIIMMVGLPGAGKSYWVEQHCRINRDKKYIILSTNNIIYKMKNNNCDCYFKIIDRATKCLKIMFDLVPSQKRNFIIDQANIYGNNRRHDNEYKRRRYKQLIYQQKFIPDSFINQMKVFYDVEYAELSFRYARHLVMFYCHQTQFIRQTLRKNNKRKEKQNNHWFHIKKNNSRSIQFSYYRHDNNIDLSSNDNHCLLLSHPKQYRRCLSTFDHHYCWNKSGSK
ncbi:unnamed protein product [Rotaria sordida]|uniref:SPRY domain-containing protein n=1 Tax=Rotaria sordida TaxID=392033 RepID=A0A818ZXI6_9BILA|nr:unnamed protein product [Rotaria sordida]